MTDSALVYTFRTKVGTKGAKKKTEDQSPDFKLMDNLVYALRDDGDDEAILPPSAALEAI
jgi:hypothetical protein